MSDRDQAQDQQSKQDQQAQKKAPTDAHEEHTPQRADEQKDATPERPVRPDEEAGESVDQLPDPPQAEGDRD